MASTTQTALITGASAGIGEAFARRLARDGWSTVLVARRRDRLEALAAELGEKHGVRNEVLTADLASSEGRAAVEERLRQDDIELLVNNAGFGTVGEYHLLPAEREVEEIELNVVALAALTHVALATMAPKGRGGIINVASMAAFQPVPYNATYAATKAFVLHFSEAVHEEARRHGVTVTALCPGPVPTEFQEVAGINLERIQGRGMFLQQPDDVVDAALSALRSRQAICIPGAINWLMASSVRLAPRFMVRQIAGGMFKNVAEGS